MLDPPIAKASFVVVLIPACRNPWFERPRRIPWAQVPSNKPEQLKATKDKNDKISEFPSPVGSEFLGRRDKNSNTVKAQKLLESPNLTN